MKAIKNLLDAAFNGAVSGYKGNHGFVQVESRNMIVFYNHLGRVCAVDISTQTFKLYHCGYHSSATIRPLVY